MELFVFLSNDLQKFCDLKRKLHYSLLFRIHEVLEFLASADCLLEVVKKLLVLEFRLLCGPEGKLRLREVMFQFLVNELQS